MIKLLLPAVLGYTTSMACPISSSAGEKVWFRPPPWVFALVWPILYGLLGYAWSTTKNMDTWYALVSFILAFWIYVYGCLKNDGLALTVLLTSIIVTVMTYQNSPDNAKTLLTPLITWLVFASSISFREYMYK